MKTNKLFLLVFTLSLCLVLLPHTLYSFVKKRLEQPKLSIQIELSNESHTQQKWMLEATENGQPLYVYEIFWCFNLTIKNSSLDPAYRLEIPSKVYLPYYSSIDSIQSFVLPFEKITTKGYYSKMQQCKEGEQEKPTMLPKEFDKVKLLLAYQNRHGITFFTLFDVKSGKSSYHRFRPLEFI